LERAKAEKEGKVFPVPEAGSPSVKPISKPKPIDGGVLSLFKNKSQSGDSNGTLGESGQSSVAKPALNIVNVTGNANANQSAPFQYATSAAIIDGDVDLGFFGEKEPPKKRSRSEPQRMSPSERREAQKRSSNSAASTSAHTTYNTSHRNGNGNGAEGLDFLLMEDETANFSLRLPHQVSLDLPGYSYTPSKYT